MSYFLNMAHREDMGHYAVIMANNDDNFKS